MEILISIVKIVAVLLILLTSVAYIVLLERRIAAAIQNRIGPNRVGWQGLLQPLADVIKLVMKEDIVPRQANKFVHDLAPVISIVVALVTFAVIPFGDRLTLFGETIKLQIASVNVGILYILALTSLGVYGVTLSGWSSNNKYSLLGGLRSSAQIISYELSMGLSIIGVVMIAGSLQLDKIVVAGEPGASIPSTRVIIESGFDAHLGDFMGTTETAGIIAFTCSRLCGGLHVNEDRFLTEVVHPYTLAPASYGENGMMVVTPLVKQAMPLLRYATNDIVILDPSHLCSCGRVFDLFRDGILGRYNDMVKVRGVQLTPQMVEEIVRGFPEVEEFFTTVEERAGLDSLLIKFELRKDLSQELGDVICRKIKEEFKRRIGLTPEVEVEPWNSLPRFELKARRFKDLRAKGY